MSTSDEDPARSFLDETLPATGGWIDPSLPRRLQPVVVRQQQSCWRKAAPLVSGLLFTAWAVDTFAGS